MRSRILHRNPGAVAEADAADVYEKVDAAIHRCGRIAASAAQRGPLEGFAAGEMVA